MRGLSIDISQELALDMDSDDYSQKPSDPLLPDEPNGNNEKQDKLQQLRKKMDDRMHHKKKGTEEPTGRDLYLQKVTNFLITSFFLNLAIEHVFTYSLVHDYVNGYMENQTYLLGGRVEGNNYCFMLFYFFRLIGFAFADKFLIDIMQADVVKG